MPPDMNHDLLTRIYLRHYAFLTRRYKSQPASAIYHLATLTVSALVSLAGLAILALGLWFIVRVLDLPVAIWAAPDWLAIGVSLSLAFLPGVFIDKKMFPLRVVDEDLIAFYSTPRERFRWWLALLSTVPLGAVVGACFGLLRVVG